MIVTAVFVPLLQRHGLEKKKLLIPKRKSIEGRNRVYYTVTVKGKKRMNELTGEWGRVKGGIDSALGGQHG
jgi:PadR family transcriptional regulator PadR